ncbi:MAG: sigma-54 dependent transcriptional regulator [Candidatus Binatus sp.]|uniref:sigma-54-dependent transcriptional regulator n=1 Tax=Candidatus Binatus sp. TaxID=2811406 RepID=UPI0027277414|nr:sigma-54 dependent transcriptional regulator [Candidatus Binatus sp.]MDO8430989.1 sigma-54 dependent transcriptional regulator [Candidatus Binatus sp.]
MKGRLLIVDDERGIVIALKGLFTKEGYEVETAESGEEALEKVKAGLFHVIITDLSMKGMSGLDLLKKVREMDPACAVLMITAYGTQRIAVDAMKAGAEDYLPKPFDNDELRLKVRKVMETQLLKRAHSQLLEQVRLETGLFENMIGRSRPMLRVFETIDKVAPTDVTVLIRGESGTGKELVARAIHFRSSRSRRPFIAVNCAAFSRELVESELFGHEKGAFTGAVARREGKFEAADGGTLFLDEIGDMALETQAKLLRVLQEQKFERIGGNQTLSVDVRIIAATNQDLEAMIAQGKFREDLYYRLKVVEIRVPPVRERREDIPVMVQHFIKDACARFSTPPKQLTPEAMRACVEAPWKGNARSLKAAIEQAVILSAGVEITPEDLFAGSEPEGDRGAAPAPSRASASIENGDSQLTFREAKEKFVGDWEREFFVRALRATGGNISRAAERTGMYRQSFQQKMRELGITLADIGIAPKGEGN